MAKSKSNPIQGYFFMGITDGELNVDCTGDSDILSAAFATLIISKEKNEKSVQQILANAVAIASEHLAAKEKYSSKKSNIVHKKPTKKAK